MPDYLDFDTKLSELTPEQAEEMLRAQSARLQAVLERISNSEAVKAELLECVVSV
jgi:hypothetical protein